MPSVELGDMDDIINQYLPSFDNNKSKFVRECVLYYHKQKTSQNKKQVSTAVFQMSIFFFLGVGLVGYAINVLYGLPFTFITTICLLLSGIELLIFSIFIGLKKASGMQHVGA